MKLAFLKTVAALAVALRLPRRSGSRMRKAARSASACSPPLTGPLATPGKDMIDGLRALLGAGELHRRRPQGRAHRRRHHLQPRPGAEPGAPPRAPGEGALHGRAALRPRGPGGGAGQQGDRRAAGHGPGRRGQRHQVGPHADGGAHRGLGQPDRPPVGRVPVQGAGPAQRHLHRPGLHLRPRGHARRGAHLHRGSAARSRRSSGTRSAPRTTARPSPAIPADTDGVSAVVVGADRVRLFEAWFNFGMDKKQKIYGGYWLQQDVLPQMDDRAVGLIGNSLIYAAGIDTPENKAFTDGVRQAQVQAAAVLVRRVARYTAGLWTKTAIDSINGKVEDRAAFLKAMRTVQVKAPRGPLKLDAYDNPIQNVYISRIQKIKHPVLGEVLTNVPVKTYDGGVAVLDLEAGGVPQARAVQALDGIAGTDPDCGFSAPRRKLRVRPRLRHPDDERHPPGDQRRLARGAAVPARERLHAVVRADARREHGARRLLPARRLRRPLDRARDRQLRARAPRRRARRWWCSASSSTASSSAAPARTISRRCCSRSASRS